MRLHLTRLSTPKRGSTAGEYEDATWIAPDDTISGNWTGRRLRIAVADGASESMLAGRWAANLTRAYGKARSAWSRPTGFVATYAAAADSWAGTLAQYVAERERRGAPITWYEEPGFAKGAHSTILVFEIRDPGGQRLPSWRAAAIGDSCVMQVRDDKLHLAFPLESADAFSSQPPLLATRRPDNDVLARHFEGCTGEWERGDSFYLATDALACWFLREVADGRAPWAALGDLDQDSGGVEFVEWVERRRDDGDLANDDTTLIRLDMR